MMPPKQDALFEAEHCFAGTRWGELGALRVHPAMSASSTKQRDPQLCFLWCSPSPSQWHWICLNRARNVSLRAGHHISALKKPLVENSLRFTEADDRVFYDPSIENAFLDRDVRLEGDP